MAIDLASHGLQDEAIEQFELTLRVAPPGHWQWNEASRRLSDFREKAAEPLEASALLERTLVDDFAANFLPVKRTAIIKSTVGIETDACMIVIRGRFLPVLRGAPKRDDTTGTKDSRPQNKDEPPMWRFSLGLYAISLFVFASRAEAQTYAELLQENERLKARLDAIESHGLEMDDHREHEHHEHHGEHSHDDEGCRRSNDPYYPGWWLPSDDYQPYSWMPSPSEGFLHDLLFGQFVETHRSPGGTPWVHPFTIEPPQLHRDAFFIYKYTNDAEGGPVDEHEQEVHVDWGLTRRFGILLAAPYLGLISPDEQATGFGDLEIAPRFVFVESDTFFLSANVLMTVPTGDETRDLGAGEMTLAPFLTTWNDLGCCSLPWTNWNTLFANFGPEMGLESGDTTLSYTVVYAHSILGPKLLFPHQHGNGAHGGGNHSDHATGGGTVSAFGPMAPIGLTNFILEFNGQTELQGEERTLLQLLTGVSYVLTDSSELRFGVNFPLNHAEEQMDAQYIFAFTHIF